jgi:peptide/nickel transport system substrate-binding protein/oligopeptide transport system substrate-binding protein
VYLFQIHRGVRFHNGREVTASDFVYSLTRLFDEPFRSQGLAAGYLDAIVGVPEFVSGHAKTIRGIRAVDRYRLEIRLSRPYSALLSALALDQASVVPRECVEAKGSRPFALYPVGCGPFRVSYRNDDERLVLASNAAYFQGKPEIDSIIFYTPKGSVQGVDTEGAKALLRGDAAMASLPLNMLDEAKSRSNIRVVRWQDLSLSFIGMNTRIPPLNDPRVRKALALAIGREEMLKLWPAGKMLSQAILPPGLPGYSPEPRTYPHDPDAARKLLASAGYGPSHPLPTLTLWKANANQSVREVDTLMVKTLAEAGIRVSLRYVSWTELDRVTTARHGSRYVPSLALLLQQRDQLLPVLQSGRRFPSRRRAAHGESGDSNERVPGGGGARGSGRSSHSALSLLHVRRTQGGGLRAGGEPARNFDPRDGETSDWQAHPQA